MREKIYLKAKSLQTEFARPDTHIYKWAAIIDLVALWAMAGEILYRGICLPIATAVELSHADADGIDMFLAVALSLITCAIITFAIWVARQIIVVLLCAYASNVKNLRVLASGNADTQSDDVQNDSYEQEHDPRLATLKKMRYNGLISKEEYDDFVKAINAR